jgi:hypothetical protein
MPHVDEGTLHAYLDGELPSAERKTLETHLAECASCRASLEEQRALIERASALLGAARPAERAAPPFEQLESRLRGRHPSHSRSDSATSCASRAASSPSRRCLKPHRYCARNRTSRTPLQRSWDSEIACWPGHQRRRPMSPPRSPPD